MTGLTDLGREQSLHDPDGPTLIPRGVKGKGISSCGLREVQEQDLMLWAGPGVGPPKVWETHRAEDPSEHLSEHGHLP